MTKVDIKRLDSITKNDTTATEQINDNFKALQEAIENTLSRDGTGPNYMDADLDMNSYRIINSSDPVEDNDIVNLKYVEDRIGGAIEASHAAVNAATQAANSAQSALVSSTNAINAVRNAEEQLSNTITYVDEAKQSITDTINEALDDVKQQALDAAHESIDTAAEQATAIVMEHAETVIKPELNALAAAADEDATSAAESARVARVWATGEDAEVHEIEADEHSSRGYADLAMAIANTPEDVPVDTSKLLALEIIKGPKGDAGDAEFSGDVQFEGSFNVHGDDNHPVKVTSLAGASASGFQVVDSNGAGESDFEHYATGDRYGTRITNKNNTSGTTSNIDFYQSNVGKSVLDTSNIDTVLLPSVDIADNSQRGATTEFVHNYQAPIIAIAETSGSVSLETNKVYTMSIVDATVFVLPASVATGVFNQIKVMIAVTGTPTVDWGTTNFFNKATPEIEEGSYDVYFDYDNLLGAWVCGVMAKGVA